MVVPRGVEPLFARWKPAVLTDRRRDQKYQVTCKTIEFFGDNGNKGIFGICGAASRIRTADLLITNQLLYQLS